MNDEYNWASEPSRLEPLLEALAESQIIYRLGYAHAICEHGVLIERNGHAFGIVILLENGYQFVMADRSEAAGEIMNARAVAMHIEALALRRAGKARAGD